MVPNPLTLSPPHVTLYVILIIIISIVIIIVIMTLLIRNGNPLTLSPPRVALDDCNLQIQPVLPQGASHYHHDA